MFQAGRSAAERLVDRRSSLQRDGSAWTTGRHRRTFGSDIAALRVHDVLYHIVTVSLEPHVRTGCSALFMAKGGKQRRNVHTKCNQCSESAEADVIGKAKMNDRPRDRGKKKEEEKQVIVLSTAVHG